MTLGRKGEQLKLFMSPSELQGYTFPGDLSEIETADRMWARKEREARKPASGRDHGSGVYESIAKEGVTSHVTVMHGDTSDPKPMLAEGHHRTASAAAIERDLGKQQFIPIHHVDIDAGSYRRTAWGDVNHISAFDDSPDDLYPQNVRKDWKGLT